MRSFLYLRGLKEADFTVFSVAGGDQKTYRDPEFNREMPYSSGQQVKRSIMDAFTDELGVSPAPITFVSVTPSFKEGEVLGLADPSYPDQLVGGYMQAMSKATLKGEKGKKPKKGKVVDTEETGDDSGKAETKTVKRRSPLSISAMRPLHPYLAGVHKEDISFDRSDRAEHHKVIVRDSSGRRYTEEEYLPLLEDTNRSLYRKWIQQKKRAGGLFVFDIAIDLRRLFTVSTNTYELEIESDLAEQLRAKGWTDSKTVFGKCLVAPKEEREKIIKALAYALVNWQITSNQARTHNPQALLALAISDNANRISGSIRADLSEDEARRAVLKIEQVNGVDLFVGSKIRHHTTGIIGSDEVSDEPENQQGKTKSIEVTPSGDAMDRAEKRLIELLSAYDYENQ